MIHFDYKDNAGLTGGQKQSEVPLLPVRVERIIGRVY